MSGFEQSAVLVAPSCVVCGGLAAICLLIMAESAGLLFVQSIPPCWASFFLATQLLCVGQTLEQFRFGQWTGIYRVRGFWGCLLCVLFPRAHGDSLFDIFFPGWDKETSIHHHGVTPRCVPHLVVDSGCCLEEALLGCCLAMELVWEKRPGVVWLSI